MISAHGNTLYAIAIQKNRSITPFLTLWSHFENRTKNLLSILQLLRTCLNPVTHGIRVSSSCLDVRILAPFLLSISNLIALLLFLFGLCRTLQQWGREQGELLIAGGKEVFSAITKLCTEDKHSTDSQSTAKEFVNAIASLVLVFSFGGFLVHFQTN